MVPAGLRWLPDGRGGVRYRLDGGFPRRGCGGQRVARTHLTSSSFRAFRFATRYPGGRRGLCFRADVHIRPLHQFPRGTASGSEKRSRDNAITTPTTSAPSATGRQSQKSQKAQACPKAGQNRRLHRYVDLRQRGGPLHRSAPHTFLFRPCTAHFSFGKTERGPRRAPRGGERRSKGAGAVFAAGGNGAERTLRRRQWGAHPPWKRPPAGAESPVAAVRRPKSSPGG